MEKEDDENPDLTSIAEGTSQNSADTSRKSENGETNGNIDPTDTADSGTDNPQGSPTDSTETGGQIDPDESVGQKDSAAQNNHEESVIRENTENERFLNSGANVEELQKHKKDCESMAAILLRAALALLSGELSEERFSQLLDASIAREEIMKARAEGEIAGRNAIIEEHLVTPAVRAPDLNGTPIAPSRRAVASIFDLAGLAR